MHIYAYRYMVCAYICIDICNDINKGTIKLKDSEGLYMRVLRKEREWDNGQLYYNLKKILANIF